MILSQYEALVIGASAGGFSALRDFLPNLPAELPLSVIVAQHLHPSSDLFHLSYLNDHVPFLVKEAEDKESIQPGVVYFSPPNYHLLVERDKTFSLSGDEKVSFSRPSIDVLFESAAVAYGEKLIGIIMTGANADGAAGLNEIKKSGGITLVQDPKSAEVPYMPQSALDRTEVDYVLSLSQMVELFNSSK